MVWMPQYFDDAGWVAGRASSAVQAAWWAGAGRRRLCWSVRHGGQTSPGHPRAATDRSSSLWPARQPPHIGRGASSQAAASATWTSVPSNRATVRQGGLSIGLFNCAWEHPQVTSRSHEVRTRRSGRRCSAPPGERHRDCCTTDTRSYTTTPSAHN